MKQQLEAQITSNWGSHHVPESEPLSIAELDTMDTRSQVNASSKRDNSLRVELALVTSMVDSLVQHLVQTQLPMPSSLPTK